MNINFYKKEYKKKGYFVVNNFYSDDEVKKIKFLLKNYDLKKITKTESTSKIIRIENLYHTGVYKIIHNSNLNYLFSNLFNFKPVLFKDKYI